MPAENRLTMTRVIVGVASVGATLALVYLYNRYQHRKEKRGSSSDIRRTATKSGEGKKVTFKTEDKGGKLVKAGGESRSAPVPSESEAASSMSNNDSKLTTEFDKERLTQVIPPVAKHEPALKNVDSRIVQDSHDSSENANATGNHNNTTNTYENNSTLKLEDSLVSTTVASLLAREDIVEEVITKSKHDGPLMTSTPLPGKDSASQVPSRRAAAATFEPHSSDLQSSAEQVEAKAKETDYDFHSYKREKTIPREIVAGLIGKKGCNIKGIQAQSNTNINFHDETLENGDRVCVIRGSPENVTIAESMIEKFILEQPMVYTETLTVPLSSVGRIIGRGGETIRSIQDNSKARVNVESHNHYGSGDSGPTRSITIKGSEDQIYIAKQLILEKVEEERTLKKNIDIATASRTHRDKRTAGGPVALPSVPGAGPNGASSLSPEPVLSVKQDGILEVFVSCVYHPNDFWIQVVGRDSIELDKLCESMTDFYHPKRNGQSQSESQLFRVGDIVAAPFEVDGKIYRAKIMKIEDKRAEVSYLDYGDRRVLPVTEIFELHPNFLQLRFQAIQATLNLGCIGEKWEDEVINAFCDLTYCAQWQSLTARVKDYLKDIEDGHDVIWIELLDKELNIGGELVRKKLATPKGPSGSNGAQQRKSYAAAALGVSQNVMSTEPVISSADPTLQESVDNRNGN